MNNLLPNKNNPKDVVDQNSNEFFESKEKDIAGGYFSERAKKMVTAVYLVTNLIPQTDPLRLSIREASIKLLSFSGMTPSGYSLIETSSEAHNLSKKIVEMLEIAFFCGYISEMNFSVLKTEFDSFSNEISNYQGSQRTISSHSLKVELLPAKMSLTNSDSNKRHAQENKALKNPENEMKALPTRNVVEAKKVSRKEAILSIIKKRGSVNIKDISSVVINCSEKTIQRELTGLVTVGTLKRTGERRWSVYSMAK